MLICNECFEDEEIKNLILSIGSLGKCEICGNDKYVCDSNNSERLQEFFTNLIKVYQPSSRLPESYPKNEKIMLVDELQKNWAIFSSVLNRDSIFSFLKNLIDEVGLDEAYLIEPVGIPQMHDQKYLEDFSILRGNTWAKFKEEVKYQNRYFTNYFNVEIVEKILSFLIETIYPDRVFFRARINKEDTPFNLGEMGAPQAKKATSGRINAAGIRCLYLGDSPETCIHEVRASTFDEVSVARFHSTSNLQFINLGAMKKISPFIPDYVEPVVIAINRKIIQEIDQEVSRATRRDIPDIEYVPTQYFSDLIKNFKRQQEKISGIIYKSVMNPSGYNVASFYPEKFKPDEIKTYKINGLKYLYDEIS